MNDANASKQKEDAYDISMYQKPVISVKEARKILAEEASELSDTQIRELIQNIEKLATHSLEMTQVRKSGVV